MDKREDIRQLINLSRNREHAAEVLNSQLTRLQEAFSDVGEISKAFWDDLRMELTKMEGLEDDLVEVFDKRLSHEAVLWAIKLYSTPEGEAFLKAMGDVSRDAMAVGTTWGDKITKKVMARHGLLPD